MEGARVSAVGVGGGGVGVLVEPRARFTAREAFTRPKPKLGSQPAAPLSSAERLMISAACAPVSCGLAEMTSAATPATTGAEKEVPDQFPYEFPMDVVSTLK